MSDSEIRDIRNFIVELQRRGIRLVLEGEQLRSRSTPGAIDAATGATLRARKAEIIEYLRQRGPGQDAPERELVPVPRDRPLPLSSAQRRLWFIDQMEGSTHYIIASSPILLHGELDRAAFQYAIDGIVARHESLRTVFVNVEGQPQQHVLAPAPLAIAEHDLSALDAGAQRAQIDRLNRAHSQQPFDLERDVMLRVSLLRLDPQRCVVLLAMHHIAADGWSIGVFLHEFMQLYTAARRGAPSPLAPLPVQYADYAQWQAVQQADPRFAGKLAYWRQRLDGVAPVHAVAVDRTRPPVKGTQAERMVHRIEPVLVARLREIARNHDATLFMLLHAALSVVVARWSRGDDIVIGTPISGRTHQKLAPMIGFFANTLVLRTGVDAQATLAELLRHVRSRCLEAYEHQDVPFDRIVEMLAPERSASYTPVVQLMFALQPVESGLQAAQDLRIEFLEGQQFGSQFDLDVVAVEEADGGLSVRWTLDPALFDTATVERMTHALVAVLTQFDRDIERCVGEVDLVDARDRALLESWNSTAREYARDVCLHALVEHQAARTPARTAMICGEERIGYREFNGQANALAQELVAQGVGPGDIVPVLMRPGVEVPLAFLALMKVGATFAPLDVQWPAQRLNAVLANLAPRLLLVADDDVQGLDADYQRYRVRRAALGLAPDLALPQSAATPIYVMHTSGSTGVPKAALNQHRGIVNRLSFMSRYFNDGADEVVLQTTYHCFDSAVWQFFWPLIKGGACVIPQFGDGFDLAQIAQLLREQRVTLTDFSPALLSLFADHVAEAGVGADWALRELIVGGEEMTPTLARKCAQALPGVRLHNFYGPSEASIGSICHALPQALTGSVPIGRPIDNVVAALVDARLQPVPPGAPGEILLGGDCVGLGYVGNDGATARAFVETAQPLYGCRRFYRTGDLARHRADGEIEFLGRIDSQVKIRGFRVELSEIQIALEAQPAVRQAHVRIAGDGAERRLVAYVVIEPDLAQDETALKARLKGALGERLPDYMVPSAYVLLESLPLTPGGKIDTRALPQAAVAGDERRHIAPATPAEIALAGIWSELFGAASIGALDDFFELGGHSLLATQLVARVRRALAVELPLRVLFAKPQLRELAQWCEQERAARVESEAVTA